MEQLRLLIDARKLGDGGIGVYLENLLCGLLELKNANELDLKLSLLISSKAAKNNCRLASLFTELQSVGISLIEDSTKPYSFSEYFSLARKRAQLFAEHDIFHSPHYTLPYFIKIPKVVTVHDIIHIDQPDTLWHKPISKCLISSALRRANAVITVSNHSKQRLQSVFPKTKKIHVVYNALQKAIGNCSTKPKTEIRSKFSINMPTFLFVGSDRPHKGFVELLKAWRLLRELSKKDAQLFVVGESFSQKTKDITQTLSIDKSVHFIGALAADELSQLYRAASAVIIASREEGFGLVALEALACHAPVISTPLPSIREFTEGSAGVYFSKDFSHQELARTVASFLNQKIESVEKSLIGQQFEPITFARKTCEVYQDVLGKQFLADSKLQVPIERRSAGGWSR